MKIKVYEEVNNNRCPGGYFCTVATTSYPEDRRKQICRRCWIDHCKEFNLDFVVEKYPKDFMNVLICPGIERTAYSLICRYCAKDCEEVDYETCFKFREKRERR